MKSTPLPAALDASLPEAGFETPDAKTTKVKKSDRRRSDILRAAVHLFDRQGYTNTSLDDVAREVGIKREALYYYYRNRAQILLAIIRPQSLALVRGLQDIQEMEVSHREKLRLAIRNHLERFDRHCLEMTVSLRDGLFETTEDVSSAMARIWKAYELLWIQLIDDGQRDAEFSAKSDAKMLTFGILGMCNWLARWYDPHKSMPLDDIIDTFFDLAAYGVMGERAIPASAPAAKKIKV